MRRKLPHDTKCKPPNPGSRRTQRKRDRPRRQSTNRFVERSRDRQPKHVRTRRNGQDPHPQTVRGTMSMATGASARHVVLPADPRTSSVPIVDAGSDQNDQDQVKRRSIYDAAALGDGWDDITERGMPWPRLLFLVPCILFVWLGALLDWRFQPHCCS